MARYKPRKKKILVWWVSHKTHGRVGLLSKAHVVKKQTAKERERGRGREESEKFTRDFLLVGSRRGDRQGGTHLMQTAVILR
jgi:hypothetical protein